MDLRPGQLERQLAGEPPRPAYLVAGSEPLLVLEAVDAVRARLRDQGYAEREVFDVERRFDWSPVVASFAAMSLFAARRVIELRLPTGRPEAEGAEVISKFCADPPPDLVLLVVCQEWSKKHGGKWSDAITRVGHSIVLWPKKPHELPDWLHARLRDRGVAATPDAVRLLADRVEGHLLAAAQEVDKLVLLAGGTRRTPIEVDEMAGLVADSARFDVFALFDAALSGAAARVVRMLAMLRAEGEQVAGLTPAIAKELLRLAHLARAAEQGRLAQAMREERIWESRMAAYKRAVERHPPSRWEAFAAECGRVDLLSKGRGEGDPWLAMERLLVAIADGRARRLLAT